MKAMKNIVVSLTTAVCFTGLALSFTACTEQSPFQPHDEGTSSITSALAKKSAAASQENNGRSDKAKGQYPQKAAAIHHFSRYAVGWGSFR